MAWKDPYMRVYVSRRVPDRVRTELEALFDVEINDSERAPERAELLDSCRGASGLVTMLTDRVDDELFDAAGPQLRIVANYAVGVDNVDLAAARERSIVVANTPDVLTRATAEFDDRAPARAAAGASPKATGSSERRAVEVGADVHARDRARGQTLGIVGLGRIGREVARLAEAFGMRVHPHEPLRRSSRSNELLAEADVVTLHCPLTPETRHLVDAEALAPDAARARSSSTPPAARSSTRTRSSDALEQRATRRRRARRLRARARGRRSGLLAAITSC